MADANNFIEVDGEWFTYHQAAEAIRQCKNLAPDWLEEIRCLTALRWDQFPVPVFVTITSDLTPETDQK
jgi:hypothetical protein